MNDGANKAAHRLGDVFSKHGQKLYVVGGAVRDLLMGREIVDIDAASAATAEETWEWLEKAHLHPFRRNNKPTMVTVSVNLGGFTFDITPFRGPSGTLEEDLTLRDFTINAMALPAEDLALSGLIDPYGGLRDLNDHILNTPSDPAALLQEDPIRVMRAARFAVHFSLVTHPNLLVALQEVGSKLNFDNMSPDRIRDELLKGLDTEKPSEIVRYYDRVGVLANLFPEIYAMKGMEQNTKVHHKDVFEHTLLVMDNAAGIKKDPVFILGALLHDAGKVKTRRLSEKGWTFYNHDLVSTGIASRVTKQLHLGKKDRDVVVNLVAHHMRLYNYSEDWTDTAVRRVVRELGEHFDDIMLMSKADITGQNPKSRQRKMRKVDLFMERVSTLERESINKPKPPIDGLRIMELLGVTPHKGGGGPLIGQVMEYLKQLVIDGELTSEDVEKAEKIVVDGTWKIPMEPKDAPTDHED